MYTICHTKGNDVLEAVKVMVKKGYKFPIFQVGQKLYKRLEKDRTKVTPFMENRKRMYTVNLKSKIIHRKSCRYADKGIFVNAYLVRPKNTGLKICKTCMG